MVEETSYTGYYNDNNEYIFSYLYATNKAENRIPRLASVIGYAQALVDGLQDTGYNIIDFILSGLDDNDTLTVVIRTENHSVIPSSFFKVITDAWVRIAQGQADGVNFNFNNN